MKSKLLAYILLLASFQARGMIVDDGQRNPSNRDVAYSLLIADCEGVIKSLIERVDRLVVSLDTQDNMRLLGNVFEELAGIKVALTQEIQNALEGIKNDKSMGDKDAQMLSFACYNLLKTLKGIDLGLIHSKYQELYNRRPNRPAASNPRPAPVRYPVGRGTTPAAKLIPLPHSLSSEAVDHIRVEQINGFCCGYNVLFNACNVEQSCGYDNCFAHYRIFVDACMNYLQHKNIHPQAGVTNATMGLLAREGVHLKKYCYLYEREGGIRPDVGTFNYQYELGIAPDELKRLINAEYEKRERSILQGIKDYLADNKSNACVHFACHIPGRTDHVILMSLIQNDSGRGLYIFDNVNAAILENSRAMRHIRFICNTFNISKKNQFKGPYLPNIWPSLRR